MTTEERPTVDVAVVTWNTAELTATGLRRLLDSDQGCDVRLLVRDNASSDDTVSVLASRVPEAVVDALRTGGESDVPTRQLARYVKEAAERHVSGMKVDVVFRRDRYLRGGDHFSFLDAGYPAPALKGAGKSSARLDRRGNKPQRTQNSAEMIERFIWRK